MHATTLCPKGKYVVDEERTEGDDWTVAPNESEEYVPLSGAAMGNPANWCCYYAGILAIGRCTNLPREEEEGEDGEVKPKGPAPEPEVKPPEEVACAPMLRVFVCVLLFVLFSNRGGGGSA